MENNSVSNMDALHDPQGNWSSNDMKIYIFDPLPPYLHVSELSLPPPHSCGRLLWTTPLMIVIRLRILI